MGTISKEPINSKSFFEWKSVSSATIGSFEGRFSNTTIFPQILDTDPTELPRNHVLNCREYYPSLKYNEEFSLFLNSDALLEFFGSTHSDWRIGYLDAGGAFTAETNIKITQHFYAGLVGSRISLKGFLALNVYKPYRFVIYDDTGANSVLLISNYFNLIDEDKARTLVKMEYRHSSDLWNFGYRYEFAADYNKVWLDMNVINNPLELELDQYSEGSTGVKRNEHTQSNDIVTMQTEQFDLRAHRAMKALSQHDDILMNGKAYTVKAAYKVEENIRSLTNNGTIEFYDKEFSTINLNG